MASNVTQRIVSATIAGVAALALTYYHPISFILLLIIITTISAWEWVRIGNSIHGESRKRRIWFVIAFVPYIAPALVSLVALRLMPEGGFVSGTYLILGLFALVWTTDIAAYVSGRMIGGPKLAPRLSPNKTWAGLIGAIIATSVVSHYLAQMVGAGTSIYAPLFGALMAIAAQTGDFLESWLKRQAGVKDSGSIMPGHGGMLDRIDGIITAAPLYAAVIFAALLYN